jgi:hypothetical protein
MNQTRLPGELWRSSRPTGEVSIRVLSRSSAGPLSSRSHSASHWRARPAGNGAHPVDLLVGERSSPVRISNDLASDGIGQLKGFAARLGSAQAIGWGSHRLDVAAKDATVPAH